MFVDVLSQPTLPQTLFQVVDSCSILDLVCGISGWIIHPNDAHDLERQTLLEWARSRLQQVIKEK